MAVGVLALQGDFIEHEKKLNRLGVETFEIRKKEDLFTHAMDGLVLPGGESTAMGKLLRELELFAPLKEKIEQGLPVFATCAGMILLAEKLAGGERPHFATLPVCVKRNAYGRQLGSFRTEGVMKGIGTVPMIFIRAPYVESISKEVQILAETDGKITAVRYGNQLAMAFHPELTEDCLVYQYWLQEFTDSRYKYCPGGQRLPIPDDKGYEPTGA